MEVWRDSWNTSVEYGEVFYRRATGELPEMESSKALALLLKDRVKQDDHILDVGCGGGHYLRSLRNTINVPFRYTGVDITASYIDLAKKAWKDAPDVSFSVEDIFNLSFSDQQFDIVLCSNMLYHLPSIKNPISELIRVSKNLVVLRTLVGERSFYIKEVHSSLWDQHSTVAPSSEFNESGEPENYNYLNIYSKKYLESIVKEHNPNAKIEFIEDTFYDPEVIEGSSSVISDLQRSKAATYILGGLQVIGYVIQPHHFVFIDTVR